MAGNKGTILVVDDQHESLALLTSTLLEEGYQVKSADSGELALLSVAGTPPELILLDMRMPVMDGLAVCRRLKEQEETREIPLMFISASTDVDERVDGLALGAVDFLIKPFHRAELLARVRTHLELSRLRFQLEAQVAKRTEQLLRTVCQLEQEIAERQRTERALRESEQRFRNMADNAPVMIVVADENQLATFFNKRWLDFTGRTMEQELGKGWIASVHPEDLERCLADLTFSYESRSACHTEYRLLRADGEYRYLTCDGVPRVDSNGTFTGYIASASDITDTRRSQEEALARQKLESLGVLAGGIAHDFNNLMGSILAGSELLVAKLGEDSPAQEEVERIKTVAERGAEIVRQLMVYAGEESTEFELVDIGDLVRQMIQLVKLSVARNAILDVDVPVKLPAIWVNAAQIRQVVMNLITNASDALQGKEGRISVILARVLPVRPPSMTEEQGLAAVDCLRLEVSDTGCGMTKETQARIFDPFFTTKLTGRGLGLAAVRGIIHGHGGTIRVVSTPGRGSSFEILLPCATQLAPHLTEAEGAIASGERATSPGTVLVIEDEDTLRLVTGELLRRHGFCVLDAADGSAGLELFRAHAEHIDVVLLDVTIPGMSGLELLSALRAIRSGVNVILTTAYSRSHAMAAMGGEQSLPYIRKPYRLKELADMIGKVCADELSDAAIGLRRGDPSAF